MATKTQSAKKTQGARALLPADSGLLTPADLLKLERIEQLKAEMKALEDEIKPKVERTVKHYGAGVTVIGDRQVKLAETPRNSVSWKSIAHAVATEDEINAVLDVYTVQSVSYTAKPLS